MPAQPSEPHCGSRCEASRRRTGRHASVRARGASAGPYVTAFTAFTAFTVVVAFAQSGCRGPAEPAGSSGTPQAVSEGLVSDVDTLDEAAQSSERSPALESDEVDLATYDPRRPVPYRVPVSVDAPLDVASALAAYEAAPPEAGSTALEDVLNRSQGSWALVEALLGRMGRMSFREQQLLRAYALGTFPEETVAWVVERVRRPDAAIPELYATLDILTGAGELGFGELAELATSDVVSLRAAALASLPRTAAYPAVAREVFFSERGPCASLRASECHDLSRVLSAFDPSFRAWLGAQGATGAVLASEEDGWPSARWSELLSTQVEGGIGALDTSFRRMHSQRMAEPIRGVAVALGLASAPSTPRSVARYAARWLVWVAPAEQQPLVCVPGVQCEGPWMLGDGTSHAEIAQAMSHLAERSPDPVVRIAMRAAVVGRGAARSPEADAALCAEALALASPFEVAPVGLACAALGVWRDDAAPRAIPEAVLLLISGVATATWAEVARGLEHRGASVDVGRDAIAMWRVVGDASVAQVGLEAMTSVSPASQLTWLADVSRASVADVWDARGGPLVVEGLARLLVEAGRESMLVEVARETLRSESSTLSDAETAFRAYRVAGVSEDLEVVLTWLGTPAREREIEGREVRFVMARALMDAHSEASLDVATIDALRARGGMRGLSYTALGLAAHGLRMSGGEP